MSINMGDFDHALETTRKQFPSYQFKHAQQLLMRFDLAKRQNSYKSQKQKLSFENLLRKMLNHWGLEGQQREGAKLLIGSYYGTRSARLSQQRAKKRKALTRQQELDLRTPVSG